MKKLALLLVAVIMLVALITGCSNKAVDTDEPDMQVPAQSTGEVDEGQLEEVTITWMQFQVEYAEQVKRLAEAYEKENPHVTIEVNVIGDSYMETLKTKAAGGEITDIFMTPGYNSAKTYEKYMLDLTNESFVKEYVDAAKPCVTLDDKIIGLPVTMNGNGIVYNKTIFADNNIEIPKTISELRAACEKLDTKGVTPFINEFRDDWNLGHFVASGYAQIPDNEQFLTDLYVGDVKLSETEAMMNNLELLDLMLEYGQDKPLDAGWNEATTMFALEEGAMIYGGQWLYGTIAEISDVDMGLFAVPQSDDPTQTRLTADVNGAWHIHKDSPRKDEALKIFEWIVTSETAQELLLTDFNIIPVIKGWEYCADDALAEAVSGYIANSETYPWPWPKWPEGFRVAAGRLYQDYVSGVKTDKEEVLQEIDKTWDTLAGIER